MFLDEMGVSLCLSVLYGWGKRGSLLTESVPTKRGNNLSVLGAFGQSGMISLATKLGAIKRTDLEGFLRDELLSRLTPGSVLVLDNATIHKGGEIAPLVARAGCRLLYLPPYSPDFNPIELAWGFMKRCLRLLSPRDDAAREVGVREARVAIHASFGSACFRHYNYLQ